VVHTIFIRLSSLINQSTKYNKMFGTYAAPLVALYAALVAVEVQAGPIPHSSKVSHHATLLKLETDN
jgi:hypothetical protein